MTAQTIIKPGLPVRPAAEVVPAIADFFVCIGAQKSGTTWLAKVLSEHPDVFMSPVKELHYFDHVQGLSGHLSARKLASRNRKYYQRLFTQWHRFPELRRQRSWYKRYMSGPIGDRWYAGLFEDRGGKRFAGEATPEYAILGEPGLSHIKRLSPDARILFIMRNPITRAWSQTLHHCRKTRRDAGRMDAAALIGVFEEAPHSAALSDYAQTLSDVARVFRPDQVKLMFYEDMHRDRAGALAEVCRFIGVGFDAAVMPELGRHYNRSQDAKLPDAVKALLAERLRDQAVRVKDTVGRIPESWSRDFGL